jgi:hypothetical protein
MGAVWGFPTRNVEPGTAQPGLIHFPVNFTRPSVIKIMYAFTGSRFTVQGYLCSEVVTSPGITVFSCLDSASLYSSIFIRLPSELMNQWFRLDLNSNC